MSNHHRVQAGERLSQIAALHGVPYQDIVAANPGKPLARLQSGEVVFAALAEGENIAMPPNYLGEPVAGPATVGFHRGAAWLADQWNGHTPPTCKPLKFLAARTASYNGSVEVGGAYPYKCWIDHNNHLWCQTLNEAPVDNGLFQTWECVRRGSSRRTTGAATTASPNSATRTGPSPSAAIRRWPRSGSR